ncbi:MAG TPA: hypothetical protein VMU35_04715 [Methylomirabilota bacterium]|nr:hypothetical protein [Methylomirabilota bacterium]
MDNIGNHRDVKADYVLTGAPEDRTRLHLRWKVWPKTAAASKLTRTERERSVASAWKKFAAALETDYKRSRAHQNKRSPPTRGGLPATR